MPIAVSSRFLTLLRSTSKPCHGSWQNTMVERGGGGLPKGLDTARKKKAGAPHQVKMGEMS